MGTPAFLFTARAQKRNLLEVQPSAWRLLNSCLCLYYGKQPFFYNFKLKPEFFANQQQNIYISQTNMSTLPTQDLSDPFCLLRLFSGPIHIFPSKWHHNFLRPETCSTFKLATDSSFDSKIHINYSLFVYMRF